MFMTVGAGGVNVWLTIDYWHMRNGIANNGIGLKGERAIRSELMLILWVMRCLASSIYAFCKDGEFSCCFAR
jgi:hypothetical protein